MSGESGTECGGMLTLLGDGLLLLVVESSGFEEYLLVDVAPVVTSCATLTEALVHAGLGLGPVLDYGTRGEGTFGTGHGGGCSKGRRFDWLGFI